MKFSGGCGVGYSFWELYELFSREGIWTIFGVRVRL